MERYGTVQKFYKAKNSKWKDFYVLLELDSETDGMRLTVFDGDTTKPLLEKERSLEQIIGMIGWMSQINAIK